MKRTLLLLTFLSILSACNKENIEPDKKLIDPVELRTDDRVTVTNLSSDPPATSIIAGDYNVLGYGYDVTGEFADISATRKQIVDVIKLKNTRPGYVDLGRSSTSSGPSRLIARNSEKLSALLSSRLEETKGLNSFKGALTSYFPNQNPLAEKYIYASHTWYIEYSQLKFMPLPQDLMGYLTDTFKAGLQSSSPQDIVKKYGTHILSGISLGAKLVVVYQSETENSDRENAAKLGSTVAINKVFSLFSGDMDNRTATSAKGNFEQKLSFKAIGGDLSKLTPTTVPGRDYPTYDIGSWWKTCTKEKAEFIKIKDNQGLIPIYEVVEDTIKKEELKQYIQRYLMENQVKL